MQRLRTSDQWDTLPRNHIPPLQPLADPECATLVVNANNKETLFVLGGSGANPNSRMVRSCVLPQSSSSTQSVPIQWERLPDMNCSRAMFIAAAYGARLYVMGGYCHTEDNRFVVYNSVERLDLLDPHSQGWTTLPVRMSTERFHFAACVRGNLVYITGGRNSACIHAGSVEVFDMETETFITPLVHQIPDIPFPEEHLDTSCFTGPRSDAGHLVVADSRGTQPIHAYSFQNKQWISLPRLPRPPGHHIPMTCLQVAARGNFLFATASYGASVMGVSFVRNMETRVWTELPRMNEATSTPTPWDAFVGADKKYTVLYREFDPTGFFLERLDVALGLPWEKEKLLLLCLQGRANDDREACPLQNLSSDVKRLILEMLMEPLELETRTEGSIFFRGPAATSSENRALVSTSHDDASAQPPRKKPRQGA